MRPAALISLLLLATLAPVVALSTLISPHVWWASVVAGVGLAAVAMMILRLFTSWVVWPSIIALGVSGIGVLAVESRMEHSEFTFGSLESFSTLFSLILRGAETLRTDTAPVGSGPGVALIVAGAVTALFVAAESLAVGADSPALAGAPLLLMWAPELVLGSDVSVGLILLSAGSYIALLAAGTRPWRALRPAVPIVAGVTCLTVLATLILTPWALSYPSWLGGVGGSASTRLDLGLDIRDDLVRGTNRALIQYQGLSPAELGPIHSHTLADFDGQEWHTEEEEIWLETTRLFPEGYESMLDQDAERRAVQFRIDDLAQDRLFLPGSPREMQDSSFYNPVGDEVYAATGGQATYGFSGLPLITDPEVWHEQSLGEGAPTNVDRYLQVPATSKHAEIEALTEEIIDGAESPYEKAVAIQEFFRTDDRFEYTTSVPSPDTDDAVWDFLDDGHGYCVQFATAMVVMARIAGIPARMAVGFLPGTPSEEAGEPGGVIRSHDAHTWPQLYLGAAGWARFEPTPAARTGSLPESAQGLAADAALDQPEDVPTAAPTQVPTDTPEPSEPPAAEVSTAGVGETGVPAWPFILAVAVIAAGFLVAFERRQRARARLTWGTEEYWSAAVQALRPLGLHLRPADTPATLLRRARDLDVAPREPTGRTFAQDLEGFAQLTRAVNDVRYAPPSSPTRAEELQQWLEETEVAAENWR